MAALSTVLATGAGALVTYPSPTVTVGDTFTNTGKVLLLVKNGSAGDIEVSIAASGATAGAGQDDAGGGTVGAGEDRLFGIFPTARYGSTTTVICSAVTDITIGLFRAAV